MNEDDIRKIAKEAAKEAVDEASKQIEEKFHRFWIEPEKHYRSHARTDKLIEVWDSTQNTFVKVILGLFIIGLFTIAALPYILKGKGVS